MEFVEKYADLKITLTEKSHLPPRIVLAGQPTHDSKRTDMPSPPRHGRSRESFFDDEL